VLHAGGWPTLLITSNPEGALPFRVLGERVGADALLGICVRSDFHLEQLAVVDPHGPGFAESIRPKSAPRPAFGLAHQSAFNRVAMHVAQLPDVLALRPDIGAVDARQFVTLVTSSTLSHRTRKSGVPSGFEEDRNGGPPAQSTMPLTL
jgi:hypothetical protein